MNEGNLAKLAEHLQRAPKYSDSYSQLDQIAKMIDEWLKSSQLEGRHNVHRMRDIYEQIYRSDPEKQKYLQQLNNEYYNNALNKQSFEPIKRWY